MKMEWLAEDFISNGRE